MYPYIIVWTKDSRLCASTVTSLRATGMRGTLFLTYENENTLFLLAYFQGALCWARLGGILTPDPHPPLARPTSGLTMTKVMCFLFLRKCNSRLPLSPPLSLSSLTRYTLSLCTSKSIQCTAVYIYKYTSMAYNSDNFVSVCTYRKFSSRFFYAASEIRDALEPYIGMIFRGGLCFQLLRLEFGIHI